jgi:hypothetical protein
MLIKFFRSSFLIQYFALILITVGIWLPGFLFNQGLPAEPVLIAPLYNLAHFVLKSFDAASIIAAFLIVFFSALTLNNILVFHDLTPKNNILPAFLFILFMGSDPQALCSYPVIIALPFFTWFLHTVYKINDEPENYMEVFNASIMVSVISMIYPVAIVLSLFIWLTLMIYGVFNGRNIVISLIALALPYIYLFLYLFWTEQLNAAITSYLDYFGNAFDFEMNRNSLQIAIWSIFAILMLLPAFLRISGTLSSFSINFRKKMAATTWLMVFAMPLILFSWKVDYQTLIFLPASIMIAHYYHLYKRSWLNETALMLLLLMIFVNNYLGLLHAPFITH